MPKFEIFDNFGSEIVHIAELDGVTGQVFHIKVSSDAQSARIIEINEQVFGKNRPEVLKNCLEKIQSLK